MTDTVKPARAPWIDRAKGYGIILVVIGHVAPDARLHHLIYIFHMPLFFLLSGMTFKPFTTTTGLVERSRALLLPYLSFGALIALCLVVGNALTTQDVPIPGPLHFLLGGSFLTGAYGIFWFPTCLLATQLLLDRILRIDGRWQFPIILVAAFATALLATVTQANPMGLLVVGMALPFVYAGYKFGTILSIRAGTALALLTGLLVFFALLQSYAGNVDYKYLRFGNLPLSVLLAFAGSAIIGIISLIPVPWLDRVGAASLTIMYVHLLLYYLLQSWLPWPPIALLAVGGGTLFHLSLARWAPTRKWLLGKVA